MSDDLRQRFEHASSILSDDLGLCGCGNSEESYALVRTLLGLTPFYNHTEAIEALVPDSAARHIVLSSLDSAGLIEHGTSIGGSWITAKGVFLLGVLRQLGDDWDRLHDVGLPHDGGDCTDACWAREDGLDPVQMHKMLAGAEERRKQPLQVDDLDELQARLDALKAEGARDA